MISDKYAVIREIATTEHTRVFLVRHIQLNALRVAKVVSKSEPDYQRVCREAMLIKDLKFDGLPIIYDIEEDNVSICIIEEYITGKSLEEYVREVGDVPPDDVVDIAVSVCDIVEYLHDEAGIFHLDIKPANIIVHENLTAKERRLAVHLIDFDSSRRSGSQEKSSYGTAMYAAPEQYFGGGDASSDIYSIGVLIAYMTCKGQWHSVNDSIGDIYTNHSNSVGAVIRRCLRHNQNQRYQSIDQLKRDLEHIRNAAPLHDACGEGENSGRAVDVYVSGTRHGVGTTHLCLCMASFLAKKGKTVAVLRHGDTDDLKSEKILRGLKNGVITHGGVVIRPEYSGCVADDYGECTYHIHDCGTDRKSHRGGINILVGDIGYRRGDYEAMEKSDTGTIIFINHASGHDFYQYSRKLGAMRCYRFPCMYRWDEGSRLFDEAMLEIFEFPKKRAHFRRR